MSRCSTATPASRSSRGEGDERFGGAPERLELGDLRADVAVQPDDLRRRLRPRMRRHISRASAMATPNLLLLRPVEMCGWLFASMSGLTRTATRALTPRAAAIASMRSISPSDSALMLRSPRPMARSSSASRLADAGEDDLRRREAGAQRDVDLADRVRVGGCAEAAQQARDPQRRVGLERVVERGADSRGRRPRPHGSGRRSRRRCRRRAESRTRAASSASGRPSHVRPRPGCVRMSARSFDSIVMRAELERRRPEGRCLLVSFSANPQMLDSTAAQPVTSDALIEQCLGGDQVGLGNDRPAELAQGFQRRLQVRRQARRSRRSDPGHLPEDLQGARHLRPPRQLPDVDHQHQPEPLHRSLPQRPQGTADDRARRRLERSAAGVVRARPVRRRRAPGSARAAAHRARQAAGDAAHGGDAARPAGVVVPGNRRPARPAGRDREVANQPRPARTGASAEAAAGQAAGGAAARASGLEPELLNERHYRPRERHRHRPRRRVSTDVSPALGVRLRRHAAARRRASGRSSSTCRRSATSTARPSAASWISTARRRPPAAR